MLKPYGALEYSCFIRLLLKKIKGLICRSNFEFAQPILHIFYRNNNSNNDIVKEIKKYNIKLTFH